MASIYTNCYIIALIVYIELKAILYTPIRTVEFYTLIFNINGQ